MAVRFAILGAGGQLGRDFLRLLPDAHALTREHIDLAQPDTIRSTLDHLRPEVLINCAAYNLVDKAESDPQPAFATNTLGVRQLALACRDLDIMLAHFSTDYVFGLDTPRSHPLTTIDPPGPLSIYGISKLAGEYAVRTICPQHFVIRTCGLYGVWGSGGKGTNFVETMLRLGQSGKPLRVVSDQRCTPTYTLDLATAALALMQTPHYGLYHMTSAGDCSWYEFAREIFRQAGLTVDLTAIPSAEYPTPARRPPYSVLDCSTLATAGVPALRPWPDALAAYLRERQSKSPSQ